MATHIVVQVALRPRRVAVGVGHLLLQRVVLLLELLVLRLERQSHGLEEGKKCRVGCAPETAMRREATSAARTLSADSILMFWRSW